MTTAMKTDQQPMPATFGPSTRPKFSGILLKEIRLGDLSDRFGFGHVGLFADDNIKKDEVLIQVHPATSMWPAIDDPNAFLTDDQWKQLLDEQTTPEARQYLKRYSCHYDDNANLTPRMGEPRDTLDYIALLNHSCEANCVTDYIMVKALRDIIKGEPITVDYSFEMTNDTQLNLIDPCCCEAPSCKIHGVFDRYKDPEWQANNYDHCTPYIKRKIDEMRRSVQHPRR
jgi:SET domain-containing protein